MNAAEQETFLSNVDWFNSFFKDLHSLFTKVAQGLKEPFGLNTCDFYYGKSNALPEIPSFYAMGLGGPEFALQVFAVFDPAILDHEGNPLRREPSLVFVAHSEGSKAMYFAHYGLSILKNKRTDLVKSAGQDACTGSLRASGKDIPFSFFQIQFSDFGDVKEFYAAFENLVLPPIRLYVEHLRQSKS